MSQPLRLGIAGLGTVGVGLIELLNGQAELLTTRVGRPLVVTAVSARSQRDRGVDLSAMAWCADPAELASRDDVDLVVELMGGEGDPAKSLCQAALAAGKSVVTANKALLALHGTELARIAEANGAILGYEAAVAGAIPIVKAVREGLAGNGFRRLAGILNGTCNYILTQMQSTGRDFAEVLAEAQALGYAEADPSFDVDGIDAAHKLAILTTLAYGTETDFDAIHIEGIRDVEALDIAFAAELGFRIKLLAIAAATEHGIEQRVHPCMVQADTPIAYVDGAFNAVETQTDYADRSVFEGRGAGAHPTASAVVADIVDIARGRDGMTYSVPVTALKPLSPAPMDRHEGPYYVRLEVYDQPGVIADISAILRDESISIESLLQRGRATDANGSVPVVLITHEVGEAAMLRALARIGDLDSVRDRPRMIRIEYL
ncbi:MAG: homoserine dehydrogenase [Alphaproteobacteria bacterium]